MRGARDAILLNADKIKNNSWGIHVHIVAQALAPPINLSISIAGANIILEWDELPGASTYPSMLQEIPGKALS